MNWLKIPVLVGEDFVNKLVNLDLIKNIEPMGVTQVKLNYMDNSYNICNYPFSSLCNKLDVIFTTEDALGHQF